MSPAMLSFEDFNALRRLIRENSGIWLSDDKVTFLQLRLEDRLRAGKFNTARDYYNYLKFDPRGTMEIEQLLDATTVKETWFFREINPLNNWLETMMPDLRKRNGRLRLWSAACSTGEEPYTLAMMILELFPQATTNDFEIVATDISRYAITTAETGIYQTHSLRHTEPRFINKYFQAQPDGRFSVNPEVRRLVRFSSYNLIDSIVLSRVGIVDMILCRNVLIYFDTDSRRVTLNNLYNALKVGGSLMLGYSESLGVDAAPFETTWVGGTVMYRKGGHR